MVILRGAELKVGLAMQAHVIEVTFEFPVLLAVQNLLGCGCELKSSWKLFLMVCCVSCKGNVCSAVLLSQMTLYVFRLLGGKKAGSHKRKMNSSSSDAAGNI